jgi:hypothetical protein
MTIGSTLSGRFRALLTWSKLLYLIAYAVYIGQTAYLPVFEAANIAGH